MDQKKIKEIYTLFEDLKNRMVEMEERRIELMAADRKLKYDIQKYRQSFYFRLYKFNQNWNSRIYNFLYSFWLKIARFFGHVYSWIRDFRVAFTQQVRKI